MSLLAFVVLAVMLAAYVLLDGYDLGVAAITPLIARSERERAASMQAIGPFWNGNEVWLIAAGGALFAFFPKAYASAFSGFYLPFMVVLWLLMFRGISIELRGHFPTRVWRDFWDFCFALSSALLIMLFGIALGNLLHGVPLDANGYFIGTFSVLLNPYAVGVGCLALLALALHGSTFIMMRIDGAPAIRAARKAGLLWWGVVVLYVVMTIATFVTYYPQWFAQPTEYRAMAVAILVLFQVAALVGIFMAVRYGTARSAFLCSCVYLGTLLAAAAATLYPFLIPSVPHGHGISIFDTSPSPVALISALVAVVLGLLITVGYGAATLPKLIGKIQIEGTHTEVS